MQQAQLATQLILVTLLGAMSCARPIPRGTTDSRPGEKPRRVGVSYPGFDKRDFPGLEAMQVWYDRSPYEWVGYYLPAPCFAGTPWTGNRQALIDSKWGLAVLYVGLQARSAAATNAPVDSARVTRCSQNSLSANQGQLDADDAVNVASADGFSEGTTIFLDVERADPYPAELDAYVRAWVARVLARRFTPGIYGHRSNAGMLFSSQKAMYTAAGDNRAPPFWVANSQGFDFGKSPAESGFPFATVWQNPTNSRETHGGVTFQVDRNVASKPSPSAN